MDIKESMRKAKKLMQENSFSCSGMQIILKMIESGIYRIGDSYQLRYYKDGATLSSYTKKELTDSVCNFLISYGQCKFSDVPKKARTREFFLNAFTDKDTYEYIKDNINDFDKEFFRDLIATNQYALIFENNAFEVMPLEYIDTEMIDIAFLTALNWNNGEWFKSVIKRKPEVISYQAWLCAVRYYGYAYNFLKFVPDCYKTELLYLEVMSPTYNCGIQLEQNKRRTVDEVPDEIFTEEFIQKVLNLNIENIARIPENYLGMTIDCNGELLEVWKVGIVAYPKIITLIKPTFERVEFFKNVYGNDSFYYNLYCKEIEDKLNK